MKKVSISIVIFVCVLFVSTAVTHAFTRTEVLVQIEEILSQVQRLQGQLNVVQGNSSSACPTLTQPLTVGMRGQVVSDLQQYLANVGHYSYAQGATGYFGEVTRLAVARWQSENGVTPAVGYWGPSSLAKYKKLCQQNLSNPANTTSGGGGSEENEGEGGSGPLSIDSCKFNNQTVTNGSVVTAYQTNSVPYGSECVSQKRVCRDGVLSGGYGYSSCFVKPKDETRELVIAAAKARYPEVERIHADLLENDGCEEWKGVSFEERFKVGFTNNYDRFNEYPELDTVVFVSETAFIPGQTRDLETFVSKNENQIHNQFQHYIYNAIDIEALQDEEFILMMDIEGDLLPSRLGKLGYTDAELKAYTDAYRERIKVARSYFPKAKIGIYGTVVLNAVASIKEDRMNYLPTKEMIDALAKVGEYGLYDDVDFVAPVLYLRRGQSDFPEGTTRAAFLAYVDEYMQFSTQLAHDVLQKSNGNASCIAPLMTAVYINGPSKEHRKPIAQSITNAYMQKYINEYRNVDYVGPIIYWVGRSFDYYEKTFNFKDIHSYIKNVIESVR